MYSLSFVSKLLNEICKQGLHEGFGIGRDVDLLKGFNKSVHHKKLFDFEEIKERG